MSEPKTPQSGVQAVAEMLNHMEPAERQKMLANLSERDPTLASKIKEQMFTFESLLAFDDASLQQLLRQVQPTMLALALRAAPQGLKEAFFRNLPKRASSAIEDELTTSGPKKLSDVRDAQKKIAQMAQDLGLNPTKSR